MRAIETIYQEMLAAYAERRGGQIEEDCELAVRLWAAAAQVQALEAQADWVLAQSFPQTAAGEYLDRHAAVRGLKRQAAAKAVGTLTFTMLEFDNAPFGIITTLLSIVFNFVYSISIDTTVPSQPPETM